MRNITKEELAKILKEHVKWLEDRDSGERANLSGADLWRANLSEADLRGANLRGADLSEADLRGANLRGANLWRANLSEADLRGADLWRANLSGADLRGADLRGANLSEADLLEANLSEANLSEANLSEADLSEADLRGANLTNTKGLPPITCPEKGSFIAFKKLHNNIIAELEIPEDALRCSATSRKCRCSKAKVLSFTNIDESTTDVTKAISKYDHTFVYKLGEYAEVKDFDTNRWNECSTGIHFFITRQEAVEY